jgi:hypothetical protein
MRRERGEGTIELERRGGIFGQIRAHEKQQKQREKEVGNGKLILCGEPK